MDRTARCSCASCEGARRMGSSWCPATRDPASGTWPKRCRMGTRPAAGWARSAGGQALDGRVRGRLPTRSWDHDHDEEVEVVTAEQGSRSLDLLDWAFASRRYE